MFQFSSCKKTVIEAAAGMSVKKKMMMSSRAGSLSLDSPAEDHFRQAIFLCNIYVVFLAIHSVFFISYQPQIPCKIKQLPNNFQPQIFEIKSNCEHMIKPKFS